jgi:hypothetical protein
VSVLPLPGSAPWYRRREVALRVVQTEHGVRGAASLEGAALLEILAFEEELGADDLIEKP